jgi:hypothetical protein
MLMVLNTFRPVTEGTDALRSADCPSSRAPARNRRANREFVATLHVLVLIAGLLVTWTMLCSG